MSITFLKTNHKPTQILKSFIHGYLYYTVYRYYIALKITFKFNHSIEIYNSTITKDRNYQDCLTILFYLCVELSLYTDRKIPVIRSSASAQTITLFEAQYFFDILTRLKKRQNTNVYTNYLNILLFCYLPTFNFLSTYSPILLDLNSRKITFALPLNSGLKYPEVCNVTK